MSSITWSSLVDVHDVDLAREVTQDDSRRVDATLIEIEGGELVFGDDETISIYTRALSVLGAEHRLVFEAATRKVALEGRTLVYAAHPYGADLLDMARFRKGRHRSREELLARAERAAAESTDGSAMFRELANRAGDVFNTDAGRLGALLCAPERRWSNLVKDRTYYDTVAERDLLATAGRLAEQSDLGRSALSRTGFRWALLPESRALEVVFDQLPAPQGGDVRLTPEFVACAELVKRAPALQRHVARAAERKLFLPWAGRWITLHDNAASCSESVCDFAVERALAGPKSGWYWQGKPVARLAAGIFIAEMVNQNKHWRGVADGGEGNPAAHSGGLDFEEAVELVVATSLDERMTASEVSSRLRRLIGGDEGDDQCAACVLLVAAARCGLLSSAERKSLLPELQAARERSDTEEVTRATIEIALKCMTELEESE